MSVERPKRNARKLPDPDFYVDLPLSLSPNKGQKRRFSAFDTELDFLENEFENDTSPRKSHKKNVPKTPEKTPVKSPLKGEAKSPKTSPHKSILQQQKSPQKTNHDTTAEPPTSPPAAGAKRSYKKKTPVAATANITPTKLASAVVKKSHKKKVPATNATTETTKNSTAFTKKSHKKKIPVTTPSAAIKSPTKVSAGTTPASPAKKSRLIKKPSYRSQLKCMMPSCQAGNKVACFIGTEGCARAGQSARWYHVSHGEHFCNRCFDYFYRSNNAGHPGYTRWRRLWSANCQKEPTTRLYAATQLLPYWLCCTDCGKWRELAATTDVTTDLIQRYTCSMALEGVHSGKNSSCSEPEDERVNGIKDSSWIMSLGFPPYMEQSPAAPYLKHYYSDGVGTMPAKDVSKDNKPVKDETDSESSISSSSSSDMDGSPKGGKPSPIKSMATNSTSETQIGFFQPFHQPGEALRALCFPPDVMLDFEIENFPEYANNLQQMYLGLRNIVVTLWCKKFKEWLTPEKCASHVICRGLSRIQATQELGRIIAFLTRRGYINAGLLSPPPDLHVHADGLPKDDVIVIGAGPAGLSAARQLHRYGVPVTVLESRDRIGGRVWDDDEMTIRVGHGAMIIVGHINNPVTLLCEQLGLKTRVIHDHCDLFTEDGALTEADMDQRIEQHFNGLLDKVAEWRKNRPCSEDADLLSRIEATHREVLEQQNMTFTEEEKLLLQFHVSNLEYACGCELNNASSLDWDQNEFYPQFTGYHSMITNGYSAVLESLAENLRIRKNNKVTKIKYSQDGVLVETGSGETIKGSKVIITVPLAILQKGLIEFDPPLPQHKQDAINGMGAGIIEKVALEFPHRFWDDKLKGADFFGLVPSSEEKRGLFGVFYDITPREERREHGGHVLMTWVSGSAIRLIEDKTNDQVVEMCMEVLRKVFSDKEVCDPLRSFVTRWGRDPHSFMSYSYVPVGSSGKTYDAMAKDVDDTIFFAGEATNRQFPQTVTGSYLSGLREANKILEACFTPLERHELITVKEDIPGKRGRKASLLKVVKMSPMKMEVERSVKALPVKLEGLDTPADPSTPKEEKPEQPAAGKKRASTAWVRAPKKPAPVAEVAPEAKTNGVARKRVRTRKSLPAAEKQEASSSPLASPPPKQRRVLVREPLVDNKAVARRRSGRRSVQNDKSAESLPDSAPAGVVETKAAESCSLDGPLSIKVDSPVATSPAGSPTKTNSPSLKVTSPQIKNQLQTKLSPNQKSRLSVEPVTRPRRRTLRSSVSSADLNELTVEVDSVIGSTGSTLSSPASRLSSPGRGVQPLPSPTSPNSARDCKSPTRGKAVVGGPDNPTSPTRRLGSPDAGTRVQPSSTSPNAAKICKSPSREKVGGVGTPSSPRTQPSPSSPKAALAYKSPPREKVRTSSSPGSPTSRVGSPPGSPTSRLARRKAQPSPSSPKAALAYKSPPQEKVGASETPGSPSARAGKAKAQPSPSSPKATTTNKSPPQEKVGVPDTPGSPTARVGSPLAQPTLLLTIPSPRNKSPLRVKVVGLDVPGSPPRLGSPGGGVRTQPSPTSPRLSTGYKSPPRDRPVVGAQESLLKCMLVSDTDTSKSRLSDGSEELVNGSAVQVSLNGAEGEEPMSDIEDDVDLSPMPLSPHRSPGSPRNACFTPPHLLAAELSDHDYV